MILGRLIYFLCKKRYQWRVDHNPKKILELLWLRFAGKPIDWKNPQTLNEKIQWLICFSDTREWSRLTDKVAVREYVKCCGLEDTLVPLLGIWKNADDIDFDSLPNKFVLKCNHDSGSAKIIDKTKIQVFEDVKEHLNQCLKRKYGYLQCEPHYNRIEPCIVAEEFLDIDQSEISTSPIDYKIFCYNGEPDVVWVAFNRHPGEYCNHQTRDMNWNLRKEFEANDGFFRLNNAEIPCPKSFERMKEAARVLSQGFPQVRVDFYDVKGKLYFGEMTFTSDCGRMPYFSDKYQKLAGCKIDLVMAKKRLAFKLHICNV